MERARSASLRGGSAFGTSVISGLLRGEGADRRSGCDLWLGGDSCVRSVTPVSPYANRIVRKRQGIGLPASIGAEVPHAPDEKPLPASGDCGPCGAVALLTMTHGLAILQRVADRVRSVKGESPECRMNAGLDTSKVSFASYANEDWSQGWSVPVPDRPSAESSTRRPRAFRRTSCALRSPATPIIPPGTSGGPGASRCTLSTIHAVRPSRWHASLRCTATSACFTSPYVQAA